MVVTINNPVAATSGDLTIAAVDLATGRVTRLFDGGTYARYAATGHLLYLRNDALMATRFDAAVLRVADEKTTVVPGLYMNPSFPSGNYAISTSGVLAYAAGDRSEFRRTLAAAGADERRSLIEDRRYYDSPRISPDGQRIAVMIRAWIDEVWTVDIGRETFARITTNAWPAAQTPIWSRDGRRIAFSVQTDTGPPNLFWAASDGGRAEERLTTSPYLQTPNTFSADGKSLVFTEERPESGTDLFVLSLEGDRSVRPLLQTRFAEEGAAISPDGRWIAYQSNR